MATNAYVDIDIPEAERLADLIGIQADLKSARDFAKLSIAAYGQRSSDQGTLIDALMTATLVRYARSFVRGVRAPLRGQALRRLTVEQKSKHAWLLAIRHKYCAHSVNAFEENQPVARYWIDKPGENGVSSIGCNQNRTIGLAPKDFQAVIDLTSSFLEYVEIEMEKEKATLLGIVRQMPFKELLERPQRMPTAKLPDPRQDRPKRKRL